MSSQDKWVSSPQVSSAHYFNPSYLSKSRFEGLQCQLAVFLESEGSKSILEIGPGPGLLTALLRHFQFEVTTIDIAMDIRPDVVGSLSAMPFMNGAFDATCAFQVLEHLPFSLLVSNMQELRRVARKRVYISVPNQKEILKAQVRFDLTLGKKRFHKVLWKKPLGRLTNPEEHYWEIGHNGITPEMIIDVGTKAGLTLATSRFCSPWFHLFAFNV